MRSAPPNLPPDLSPALAADMETTARTCGANVAAVLEGHAVFAEPRLEGHHNSAALSGGMFGLAHFAWHTRPEHISAAELADKMAAAIRFNLTELERRAAMGGPVAGHG